ncbi:Os01g0798100, partial [Oryza sativa Japonica Group]
SLISSPLPTRRRRRHRDSSHSSPPHPSQRPPARRRYLLLEPAAGTTTFPRSQRPALCSHGAGRGAIFSRSHWPAPPLPSSPHRARDVDTIAVCVRFFAQLRQLAATTTPGFGCGWSKCASHCTAVHSHEKVSSIKMNEHPATCALLHLLPYEDEAGSSS